MKSPKKARFGAWTPVRTVKKMTLKHLGDDFYERR